MKKILIIACVLCVFGIVYLAGPKLPNPELSNQLPEIQVSIAKIDSYMENNEFVLKIEPDNESRIIWANDSLKNKTAYSLLYSWIFCQLV